MLALGAATGAANAETDTLDESDWDQIRAEHDRHRHAAVAGETGYFARNHSQQWLIEFDGRGFTAQPEEGDWSWGLELVGYGPESAGQTVDGTAPIATELNRVSYAWNDAIEEWFVNETRGLEHGFTLHERPADTGEELLLKLAVRGGLRPEAAGGRALSFVDDTGEPVVRYTGLKVWDSEGTVLPARLDVVDENQVRFVVDDRGAKYPITVDPLAQQAYLKASNANRNDGFGDAVAISGDTVVVGAPGESSNGTGVNPASQADNSAPNSGAAYVFVRSNGVWTQQAYLKGSNTRAWDDFGNDVAISGDTVVVGAKRADDSGAAYVFVRSGGVWAREADLKASNAEHGDDFGISVDVSGDFIVVGALSESSAGKGAHSSLEDDNSAEDSGAAYVFVRWNGTWYQDAYLKASNTDMDDSFGRSVAISGYTVVVGAPNEASSAAGVNPSSQSDNSADATGAVYVFKRGYWRWYQSAYLKASNPDEGDSFGASVAVSGDTVIVGAPSEAGSGAGVNSAYQSDNGAYNAGAAYIFKRDRNWQWTQQAYVKASNAEMRDAFGVAVDISGDIAVVGATGESGNGVGVNPYFQDNNGRDRSGAAYVFVRTAGTWLQQAYLKASNPDSFDHFGISVAVSGDTVAVGARNEDGSGNGVDPASQSDNSASGSGAAYVFRGFDACVDSNDVDALSDRVSSGTTELPFDDFTGDGIVDTSDVYALQGLCTNADCGACR